MFVSLCHVWWAKICLQLLAKSYLLIKDAKELDTPTYYDFISALVALRRGYDSSLYIFFYPYFHFYKYIYVNITQIFF